MASREGRPPQRAEDGRDPPRRPGRPLAEHATQPGGRHTRAVPALIWRPDQRAERRPAESHVLTAGREPPAGGADLRVAIRPREVAEGVAEDTRPGRQAADRTIVYRPR